MIMQDFFTLDNNLNFLNLKFYSYTTSKIIFNVVIKLGLFLVARIVLPSIKDAKKKIESARKNIPLVVLIIIFLLSAIVGVIYFHGQDLRNAPEYTGYNDDWFSRNDNSKKPPNLIDYLKPKPQKKPKLPNLGVLFRIEGDASFYAWRFQVLDSYLTGTGWIRINDTFKAYLGEARGSVSFIVHKELVNVTDVKTVELVSLWDPAYGTEASSFAIHSNTSASIMTAPQIGRNDEELRIVLYASKPAIVNITYRVFGSDINEQEIASRSSTVSDTKSYALSQDDLRKYTEIPDDYFAKYPEVKRVFDILNESIDADENTVYEAIAIASSLLRANYTIYPTLDLPEEEDPVAKFIGDGGGSIAMFVYTVALFMRYIKLPTRVILGIMGGRYNVTTGITELDVNFLRYWLEVYDRSIGWVPFNVDPYAGDLKNLAEVTFRVSLYIITQSPGTIGETKATYLDVNFTLYVEVKGIGISAFVGRNVTFYELNETVDGQPYKIGEASLRFYDEQTLIANITTSYETIYNALGRDPVYGLHYIAAIVLGFTAIDQVLLVKRAVIT